MEYSTKTADIIKAKAHCILVPVFEKNKLSQSGEALDKASGGQIKRILKQGDMTGKVGQSLLLHEPDKLGAARLLLVGFGNEEILDAAIYAQSIETCIQQLNKTNVTIALSCLLDVDVNSKSVYWKSRKIIEIFSSNTYRFTHLKSKAGTNSAPTLSRLDFQIKDKKDLKAVKQAIVHGSAIINGIKAAKDLANSPGNICTPTYMAKAAKKLAKDFESITTSVLEEKDMKRLGMGALLSVSQGSAEPAKLITIQHKGAKGRKSGKDGKGGKDKKSSQKPYVLVGKGISFDSGGISLKPGAAMSEMIYDMCGAATVLGVMTTIAKLDLPVNVIGVITSAENMPSGTASRPGDIVTSMSGQTIEILNTDAEGRLVLSDALTYIEKFNPETVIDVATLTGACVIALGSAATALYANDESLAADIIEASEESMDKVWRMPLWDEYQKQINSNHADMANIGGREAGSVTAACFLSRFTKKYRWAHLDIAGTAWKSGAQKSATGRPVILLCQYILDRIGQSGTK